MRKIILTGGGTAGHVTPHLSILPSLIKEYEIHYIGSISGIERDIINKYKYITYHPITTVKFERSLTLKNLLIPFKLFKGIRQSKKIIKELKPSIIFSKGGFVSVPVCYAAHSLKVPIVGHESDYSMGLANKLIYKKCNSMCFSFKDTQSKYIKKGVYAGSPIRESIYQGNKEKIVKQYNLDDTMPTLLMFGGSLGAKAINEMVFLCCEELSKKFNILHIVGKGNLNSKIKISNYHQIEFTNNIEDYFACANIVISRAGSNSIFELCAIQKPMLLIPLPKDSSRGDQILNAEYLEKQNLCLVLFQENMTKETFIKSIIELYQNRYFYINNLKRQPNFNGTKKILEEIKKYSK